MRLKRSTVNVHRLLPSSRCLAPCCSVRSCSFTHPEPIMGLRLMSSPFFSAARRRGPSGVGTLSVPHGGEAPRHLEKAKQLSGVEFLCWCGILRGLLVVFPSNGIGGCRGDGEWDDASSHDPLYICPNRQGACPILGRPGTRQGMSHSRTGAAMGKLAVVVGTRHALSEAA